MACTGVKCGADGLTICTVEALVRRCDIVVREERDKTEMVLASSRIVLNGTQFENGQLMLVSDDLEKRERESIYINFN